jgi:hypothetical protein
MRGTPLLIDSITVKKRIQLNIFIKIALFTNFVKIIIAIIFSILYVEAGGNICPGRQRRISARQSTQSDDHHNHLKQISCLTGPAPEVGLR